MLIRADEVADKDTLADGRLVVDVFKVYHPWSEQNPDTSKVARIHLVCANGSFLSLPPEQPVEIKGPEMLS